MAAPETVNQGSCVQRGNGMSGAPGIVYLVGAGPGDPGLLTVRGLQLLREADVVVHDRLVGKEILEEVGTDARLVNASKSPGDHRLDQDSICELIIAEAKAGHTVVRLKGGDPFIYGRGYEEVTACRDAGVECVVIPGVSSAFAAPAAAGIPITDRRLVRSVGMMAGRPADWQNQPAGADAPAKERFKHLAAMDAVIILMGRSNLRSIAQGLIEGGCSAETPIACIERATTPEQRVTVASLATVADVADREDIQSPMVAVVGEVAALAKVGGRSGTHSTAAPVASKEVLG